MKLKTKDKQQGGGRRNKKKSTVRSPGISSAPFAKQDFSSWREDTGVNAPQCRNTTTLWSKMMF